MLGGYIRLRGMLLSNSLYDLQDVFELGPIVIYLKEHFVLEFLGKLCTTQKSISLGDHIDVISCYFLCLLVIEPEGSDIFQERMVTTDSIFKLVHGLLCVSVDLLTILIFKEHK